MRLHTRTIVRDRDQAFIGSQSLRRLELDSRREIGFIFRDASIVEALTKMFEDDWTASKPEKAKLAAKSAAVLAAKTAKNVARVVSEKLPIDPVIKKVAKAVRRKAFVQVDGNTRRQYGRP